MTASDEEKNLGVDAGASPILPAHTPLPWVVEDELTIAMAADGGAVVATVLSYDDFPCADEEDRETIEAEARANAAFIVTAANGHHKLVEALREQTEIMEELGRGEMCFCTDTKGRGLGQCVWCDARDSISAARAALSNLKEE